MGKLQSEEFCVKNKQRILKQIWIMLCAILISLLLIQFRDLLLNVNAVDYDVNCMNIVLRRSIGNILQLFSHFSLDIISIFVQNEYCYIYSVATYKFNENLGLER